MFSYYMKYLLSLDGGGVRGIATLEFLRRFEEHYQTKCADFFDFFAGTSIGGLIGLSLASGKSAEQTLADMLDNLNIVMDKSCCDRVLPFQCKSIYNGKGKKRAIEAFVSDIPLSGFSKPIMIPTYDITNRKVVLHTAESDLVSARVLADATTAAPSYFPPVQTGTQQKGKKIFEIDGGVAVNNPALIAMTHATKTIGWETDEIKILSVGTGMDTRHISGVSARKWGILGWITNGITKIMVQAPVQVYDQACDDLIGDNYLRINSDVQPCKFSIDSTGRKNIECLISMGSGWFDEYQDQIDNWIGPTL